MYINDFFNDKVKAILAPMAGVGDVPFRKTVRRFGNELLFGEMIASEALIRNHPETIKLSTCYEEEQPVVIQIMGSDPKNMAEAGKIVADKGSRWVDINMGCPVKKIVSNNSGSALMKDLKQASNIIREVVKAVDIGVTVKMRLGWDSNNINVIELAQIAQEEGAKAITIHGRTKSQMYSGISDWELIKQAKSLLKIPVIGNGDINSSIIAKERIDFSSVNALMVGRAMMGKPWLLSEITHYLETGSEKAPLTLSEIKETMLYHLDEIMNYYGLKAGAFIARKHMCWYAIGVSGAREFRGKINSSNSYQEIKSIIEEFFK